MRSAIVIDGVNAAMLYRQQWLWQRVAGLRLAGRRAGSAFEESSKRKIDPVPFDAHPLPTLPQRAAVVNFATRLRLRGSVTCPYVRRMQQMFLFWRLNDGPLE